MQIRLATASDAEDLLEWRNDQLSQAMSINSSAIEESEHKSWLKQSLQNPNRTIYIGELKKQKIGTCRFDYDPDNKSAEVSINVNPQFRGKKLAGPLLQESIKLFKSSQECTLVARVKPHNTASEIIFEQCGFVATQHSNKYTQMELK